MSTGPRAKHAWLASIIAATVTAALISVGASAGPAQPADRCVQYDYVPNEIDAASREAMIDRLADDIETLCVGLTGPQGEVLPDLSSAGREVADLFNIWWFGDEQTLADYRRAHGQQPSHLTGGKGHQEYFLERVRSVRSASISVVGAKPNCWMFDGTPAPRSAGDDPCASVSKLGTPAEQLVTLQRQENTAIDVSIPIRATVFDLDDAPKECDAKITISLLWDEADERWEAFQITICGYPSGDLWMTSPLF